MPNSQDAAFLETIWLIFSVLGTLQHRLRHKIKARRSQCHLPSLSGSGALAARVAWPDRLERYFDEIGFHRSSTMSATICRPILHIDKNQSHTPIEASIVGMQGLTVFLGTHINIKK